MSFAKNLPTVQPYYPLVGNALSVLWKTNEEQFDYLYNALSHPAKLFTIWLGVFPFISTNDPVIIQKILTHPHGIQKPYFFDFFKLEFSVLIAQPSLWKTQRKALNPSFNQKILNGFIPIFDRCAQSLVKDLLQSPEGEQILVTNLMTRCALAMVCATTIGSDINEDPDAEKFAYLMNGIIEFASKRFLNLVLYIESIYRLTKDFKMEEAMREEALKFIDKVFQNALIKRAERSKIFEGGDQDDYRKPKIFIDQLLDLHDQQILSDIELHHNVCIMIIVGSDTTGTTMGFIAQLFGIYPHLQEKVYQEIKGTFPSDSELDFTPERLAQLQYTEMFIKESLRHFPVAPIMLRQTTGDIELDDTTIPTGTLLQMSIYNLHRRKDLWGPDAEDFNPENFSEKCIKGRRPFAYIPFGGGNRNCIGNRYAMISMKIMVVHLLINFRFKSDLCLKDLRLKFNAMLKFSKEPGLLLERRVTLPVFTTNEKRKGQRMTHRHNSDEILPAHAILPVDTWIAQHPHTEASDGPESSGEASGRSRLSIPGKQLKNHPAS
ncbi:cytochrome P450 4c21-like [Sabethes cyaneus]|uniref:cytochrome P450 4c21-like n=1 Tax=Sabethes cyaneus TaxID=53552 RepID=UPI00237DEEF0|nr:cytochrome P450 4c21-like [Sabethes cyaneus]